MCNKIHPESQYIKPYGYGWKLFRVDYDLNGKMFIYGKFTYGNYETDNICGWVNWDHTHCFYSSFGYNTKKFKEEEKKYGFCLFKNYKEAKKMCREANEYAEFYSNGWQDLAVLFKVQYAEGLGFHKEPKMKNNEIIIVKAFRRIGKPIFAGSNCRIKKELPY